MTIEATIKACLTDLRESKESIAMSLACAIANELSVVEVSDYKVTNLSDAIEAVL